MLKGYSAFPLRDLNRCQAWTRTGTFKKLGQFVSSLTTVSKITKNIIIMFISPCDICFNLRHISNESF